MHSRRTVFSLLILTSLALLACPPRALAAAGDTLTGVICDRTGTPVAGAEIVITQDENVFAAPNRRPAKPHANTVSTQSAADGTFTLPLAKPKREKYALGVAHDAGYADVNETNYPADGKIRLQPWGKIEGTIVRAGKPLADATVRLEHLIKRGRPSVSFDTVSPVDADGRFTFARVVPGFVSVVVSDNDKEILGRFAEVEGGKTAKVQLGGGEGARVVTGTISLRFADDIKFDKLLFQANGLTSRPPFPDFYEPENPDDPHGQAYENEIAFRQTDEGKALFRKWIGFGLTLNPDGSFRIEGVPPGEYDLHIYLDRRENGRPIGEPLVEMDRVVTVPEGPAGEPVDVGVLDPDRVERPPGL